MVVPEHQIVEGIDAHLHVAVSEPGHDAGLRPVLLLHGFASSTQLNWADPGWLGALTDAGRRVIGVDLPGHGRSAAPADPDPYVPSRIRADLVQILNDAGVYPLDSEDRGSGVDIVGYSFGARLAWELGASQPELVHRLVLGGPSPSDRLTDFDMDAAREFVEDDAVIENPVTASFMDMAKTARANLPALLRFVAGVQREPYTAADCVPPQPVLLVAGETDEIAASMQRLADLSGRAEVLWLPGRNHVNAVTSRTFKSAAVDFLAR